MNPLMGMAPGSMMPGAPMGGGAPASNPLSTTPPDQLLAEHGDIVNQLSQLVAKPDLKSRDVYDLLADLIGKQHVTAQKSAELVSTMPADQKQLRPWVMQQLFSNIQTGRQLHQKLRGG